MKKNNCLLLAMLMAVALLLSGCQLALEDGSARQDRFVGVNVVLMRDHEEYSDAPQRPHEPNGYLLSLLHSIDDEGAPHIGTEVDEHFNDVHVSYKSSTQGDQFDAESANHADTYAISGTLYIEEAMLPDAPVLSLENVYQRSDGTLYAIEENSMGKYAGSLDGLTLTISQDSRVTDGAYQVGETVRIEVNVRAAVPAASIVLIEMDENNMELRRQTLGEIFDVSVAADTAWALIEERLVNGAVRRTALNLLPREAFATVLLPGEDGVCLPVTYTLDIP